MFLLVIGVKSIQVHKNTPLFKRKAVSRIKLFSEVHLEITILNKRSYIFIYIDKKNSSKKKRNCQTVVD